MAFGRASCTWSPLHVERGCGNTDSVLSGQGNRLPAQVAPPHGGRFQSQGLAYPDEQEGSLLLWGGKPLQVPLILADHSVGLLTTAVSLRDLIADREEVRENFLQECQDGREPWGPGHRGSGRSSEPDSVSPVFSPSGTLLLEKAFPEVCGILRIA